MSIFDEIYMVTARIPEGKVTTYGNIARLVGNPRLSRVVGYALHINKDPEHVPCHRVVNRFGEVSGSFAFGGDNRQRELLEKEGVRFDEEGRVMKEFFWET